jgi:hypothetical protein
MANFDEAEFKRVVSTTKITQARQAPGRTGSFHRASTSKIRRAAGKMLESFLTKAGLDVGKLNELLAQDQAEARSLFKKQIANADFSGAQAAYRQGIEAESTAIGLLASPFTSMLLTLDKPFWINEVPHSEFDIYRGSHYESLNSWIKIYFLDLNGTRNTSFVFNFVWQNDSDSGVVINASSRLALGGYCALEADNGVLFGDSCSLTMGVELQTMRWSGWGIDQPTQSSNDQTLYPSYQASQTNGPPFLWASGEGLFSGPDFHPYEFFYQPFDVQQSHILVPGRAVAVFQVRFDIYTEFGQDGDNVSTSIEVDFNTGSYGIFCPFVLVEVLGNSAAATPALQSGPA